MTTYDILPFEAVGDLRFGTSRLEVHVKLGAPFRTFKRTPESVPADHFREIGIFTYYDQADRLNAVEMASPAEAILNGTNLSILSFSKLKNLLAEMDSELQVDLDGLTAPSVGIGAWFPDIKEDIGSRAETIIAFVRTYYG